ncbi:MAG: DUF971 domain-containing protein [Gammaproteobacteria bacterium]|nr:DUF971 domain-containing protein [Gammaproteobacteria bacterium]
MQPQKIILHQKSATLELVYADNQFILTAGYLRMKSPAADNKGKTHIYHQQVTIDQVTAVGNYAVQIKFSDGHNTGIYSWGYIRLLCVTQQSEMARVAAAEKEGTQVLKVQPAPQQK